MALALPLAPVFWITAVLSVCSSGSRTDRGGALEVLSTTAPLRPALAMKLLVMVVPAWLPATFATRALNSITTDSICFGSALRFTIAPRSQLSVCPAIVGAKLAVGITVLLLPMLGR